MRAFHRARLAAPLLVGLAFVLVSSCATRLPETAPAELLAPLDAEAGLYVEARGGDVVLLAKALEVAAAPENDRLRDMARSLRGVGSRSRLFGLALLGPDAPGTATKPALPDGEALPPFEAAISGDFDSFGLCLGLVTARGWRRTGAEWKNAGLDLALALPRRGLLVAAKGSALELAARTGQARPSPIPRRYEPLLTEGLLAWFPDPLHRLAPRLGFAELPTIVADMPAFDLLLVLGREGLAKAAAIEEGRSPGEAAATKAAGETRIDIRIFAITDSERTARIIQPAIRLGWYFLARELPLRIEGEPRFEREGATIRIEGLGIPLSSLVELSSKTIGGSAPSPN